MRITGGLLCRRNLQIPPGEVRPTTDRVRESVFATIAPLLDGARVLDLFAGSGALGLEAASRGAAAVTWVERDPAVHSALRRNVLTLCHDLGIRTDCVRQDVHRFMARDGAGRGPWDVILADPPYDAPGAAAAVQQLMDVVQKGSMLASGGMMVYEMPARVSPPVPEGWRLVRDKAYGRTRVAIWTPAPAGAGDDCTSEQESGRMHE